MLEPPLGAIDKAEPGTACVWSRFSDQVTVTVTPSAATVADDIVGAVVSMTMFFWPPRLEAPPTVGRVWVALLVAVSLMVPPARASELVAALSRAAEVSPAWMVEVEVWEELPDPEENVAV